MTNYEKWKAEQPAIERLLEEIQRLAKVYAGNQIALGVLQDIQNQAIEDLPACQGATLPKTLVSARADCTPSGHFVPSVFP